MKTKGIIYIASLLFVMMFAACEEEHIMTKYEDGAVFLDDGFFKSAYESFEVEFEVTHRSLEKDGKYQIKIEAEDGSPLNTLSLSTTEVDFSVSDTITITASIDYNTLIEDQIFKYTLMFSDDPSFGGFNEYVIEVTKFKPALITDFVGTWSGTEIYPNYGDYEHTITGLVIEQKDATTLTAKASAGLPPFQSLIFSDIWGETFIDGYGLNGDVELVMNLNNGEITLEEGKFWGVTDAGYGYYYTGSGTWLGGNEIILHFELHWDDSDFTDGGNKQTDIHIKLDE